MRLRAVPEQLGLAIGYNLYTGRQLAPATGLYYYRARRYDTDTDGFLQPTPNPWQVENLPHAPHAGAKPWSSWARRLRATCSRRLMVPTGESNSSLISTSERPRK